MSNPTSKERVSDDRVRLVLAEISDYRSSQPWRGELKACLEELQERRAAETPAECAACAKHEKEMMQALEERDANAAYADQLTAMIGVRFETDHGEHTSGNFPWENAIETMRVAIGLNQEQVKSTAPRAIRCDVHGIDLAFDGDKCWECEQGVAR